MRLPRSRLPSSPRRRSRPPRRISSRTTSWSRTSRSTACAACTRAMTFDLGGAWALDDRVALRHESFGALAYHFGTRRLSFLKHPQLVRVVEELAEHPCASDALRAAGVERDREAAMTRALGTLAETGMIVPRETVAA